MKKTKIIMGMPITVEVLDSIKATEMESVFEYFRKIDRKFSTYKKNSEISRINRGLSKDQWSEETKEVFNLSEQTKLQTGGYFNIENKGIIDPSGLVKGWSIHNASKILLELGYSNFYIEAGGDIEIHGYRNKRLPWDVGIRNPFNVNEIIKVLRLTNRGVATSGSYIRGEHIYNPIKNRTANDVASLTVIATNIYDADRFATAAYAMGQEGINFIEGLKGMEGYMVSYDELATYTSGFKELIAN